MESAFRLPVVAAGSEYLVMGHLMRRNILTYKAPPGNEGYDLICIHPDPRHKPKRGQVAQVRVQVKSRYATDSNMGFPLNARTITAFDFLIAAFLNVGNYYRGRDGADGARTPDYYTIPSKVIRKLHIGYSSWEGVRLKRLSDKLSLYHNEMGFELIAEALGVPRPRRVRMPD